MIEFQNAGVPSRRTFLCVATTMPALAGCTTAFGGNDGTHEFADGGAVRPDGNATVAASDSTEWQPDGSYIEATGLLFERDDDPGFVLVARYRVESGDDWHHSAFRTTHEWRPIPGRRDVAAIDSNTQPTDDEPRFTLELGQERGAVDWTLSFVESERWPKTYKFASSVDSMSPKPGDRVAQISFTAEYVEDSPFGSEHETGSRLRLEYGEGAADDWAFDS